MTRNEKRCSMCGSFNVNRISIVENWLWWIEGVYRCSDCGILNSKQDVNPCSEWGWYHNARSHLPQTKQVLLNLRGDFKNFRGYEAYEYGKITELLAWKRNLRVKKQNE